MELKGHPRAKVVENPRTTISFLLNSGTAGGLGAAPPKRSREAEGRGDVLSRRHVARERGGLVCFTILLANGIAPHGRREGSLDMDRH